MLTDKTLSSLGCSSLEEATHYLTSCYLQGGSQSAEEIFLNASIRQRNHVLKTLENSEEYQPSIHNEIIQFFTNLV